MKSCDLGLIRVVKTIIGSKPFYNFNEKEKIIEIINIGNVNDKNSIGIANSLANKINKDLKKVNDKIGNIAFSMFYKNKGAVRLDYSNTQLDLINAKDKKEKQEIEKQLQIENQKREFQELNKEANIKVIKGEVIIPENEQLSLFNNNNGQQSLQFQLENNTNNSNLQQSKASKETLDKIKKAIVNKGISLVQLEEYIKNHPDIDATNVNALADTIKGIVALSNGSEEQALTEEYVHIATAIIEQTNPKLITALISKIDKYKIYNKVLESYKNNKAYQLSNGKPDIRKIKKEAVDKLIAEYIIKQSEGSEQFPELFDLEQRSFIQTMWDTITTYISQLFNAVQLNFEQTASMVADGSFEGDVSNLNSNGEVMFQLKFPKVEELANKFKDMHQRTKLIEVSDTNEKRHYEVDGVDKMKKTSSSIKKPFTKERSESEKLQDGAKKNWGSEGHKYIENYIKNNLIDENGYKLEAFKDIPIETKLSKKVQSILKANAIKRIESYPEGTIFLVETNVNNKAISFGSMIDFVAISPTEDKKDIIVDILDWKFIAKNKNNVDIIEDKKQTWKQQMDYYRAIAVRLGVKGKQFKKTQMIPFVSEYAYSVKGDKNSPLNLISVSTTDVSDNSKTELFMLPVATLTETSGNQAVDGLIKALNTSYDKIAQQATTPENAIIKKEKLEKLNEARRKLQGQLNFEPLYEVGKTLLQDIENTDNNYKNKDFASLNDEEIKLLLAKLKDFQDSAKKFIDLPVIYNDFLPEDKNIRTEQENKQLKDYERLSARTTLFEQKIEKLQVKYYEYLSLKTGKFSQQEINDALLGEKTITNLDETFLESSKINSVFFKLGSFMYLKAKNKLELVFNKKATEYGNLLQKVSKIASSTSQTAFDLIGVKTEFGPQLLKKYSQEFIKKKKTLLKSNNVTELKKLIDIDKYDALLKTTLERRLKYIDEYVYSSDVEENEKIRQLFKNVTEQNLDINNSNFKGGNDSSFKKLFNEALIDKPEILSEGYKNMLQNQEVLDLWNYFTNLNKKAYALGYIKKQGLSFLPLVEASTGEKIKNNGLKGLKDTATNLIKTDVNEQNSYNSVDMETSLLVNKIPKLFTRTNKEVSMLSTDLTKIGLLYIKALDEYEMISDLEYTLQTLASVYKKVPEFVMENGMITFIGDAPVTGQANLNNASFFQTVINDHLYKQSEDVNSFGNSIINTKFANTEEGQQKAASVKKGLESANSYLRLKALGLAPVTAVSNLFGTLMNGLISNNNLYTKIELAKNVLGFQNNKQESLKLKALIDFLTPFAGESTLQYQQRKISKGISYKNYLNSWSFTDVMMTLNSTGEKLMELANAKTLIENSIVINGEILNARQYLVKQDQSIRSTLSESERMALEKTLDSRVKELKASDKSLLNIISFDETKGELNTNTVSEDALSTLRMQIIDISRNMTGQMSYDDKMGFNRDILAKSAMMFKGWIPKLVSVRAKDITKNVLTDDWEIGRYRSVIGLLQKRAFYRIQDIKSVLRGDDRGLAIIEEMYQSKKDKYKRDTGKELTISVEEYQDLIRQNLKNAFTEIKLIVGLASLVLLANLSAPDDDDDKSAHKLLVKQLNRIMEELTFFVNPKSADEITRGSIIPAFGVLNDVITVFTKIGKEGVYLVTDDAKDEDKNYVITTIVKRIPGLNQFQQVIVPFLFPEYAKENGIKIEKDFRR